ncbi:MAG: ATP-binding cassette domain-containing protein [Alphaproteobacteria bacterium]
MPISGDKSVMLTIEDLKGGYGGRLIIDGVSLSVGVKEIVTIIGHNGAGKSTVLKAIFNMLPVKAGSVELKGRTISRLAPHKMLAAGIAYVPQTHSLFPRLTIAENGVVTGRQ